MANISEIQLELAKQIGAKELKFARFNLLVEKDNIIHISKGKKFIIFSYNRGSDMYDLRIGRIKKDFSVDEKAVDGVFFDMLRGYVESHFKFEYVMDSFMASMRG